MKDNNNNKTIYQSLSLIKDRLVLLKDEPIKVSKAEIDQSITDINQIFKMLKGLKNLFLILISLLIVLLLYFGYTEYYREEVRIFNNKIDRFKQDSLIKEILDIKIDTIDDKITTEYFYRKKGEKVIKYSDLISRNDSLTNELLRNKNEKDSIITSLSEKLGDTQIKIRLLEGNYPIKFKETEKDITIYSPELDSALILLKHYRHKMKFNEESKVWIIDNN